MSSAESAYLFRHALLRDAAYQLQMPADRARLHELAFEVMEGQAGGRAPAESVKADGHLDWPPHASNGVAAELAEHAGRAGTVPDDIRRRYVLRADLHERQGRLDEAERDYQRALEMVRSTGDERMAAVTLRNLAFIHHVSNRFEQAESACRTALEIARRLGERRSEGSITETLAEICASSGRTQEAEPLLRAALAIHRDVGNRRDEGRTLGNLGALMLDIGRLEESEALFRDALALHAETGYRRAEATHGCQFAMLLAAQGRRPEANEAWDRGISLFRDTSDAAGERRARQLVSDGCARLGIPGFSNSAEGQK